MRIISTLTFLFALCLPLAAQLDIPKGEEATPSSDPGVEIPRSGRGDLAPKRGGRQEARGGLDVGEAKPKEVVPADPKPAVIPPTVLPASGKTTGAILESLIPVVDPTDPRIASAVNDFLLLGEAGLSAGRAALHADGVGPVLCGAEVLLASGTEADRDQVAARLLRRLPARAIPTLLGLLTTRDPMRASPELLCEMLDHQQSAGRTAAARQLAEILKDEHVPLLAERLRSSRSDTRLLALEMLAGLSDPSVTNLLIDRLADPTAKVAARAAQLVGMNDLAEPALIDAAFPAGALERRTAYARIAIAEREDRLGRGILDVSRVPALLPALSEDDPLQRGVAAILLAGIGFRGEGSRGFDWLDREVPHELVRQMSGEVFHRDFSSLVEPIQRRLVLLTGRAYGADAESWRAWWVGAYPTFRAHRAVLDVAPEDVSALDVWLKLGSPSHRALRFLGPTAAGATAAAPTLGSTVFVTEATASDLVARFIDEGVFSASRLPSTSNAFSGSTRELEVRVGDQAKSFVLPGTSRGEDDAWFDRIALTLERLELRNRWQRYPAKPSQGPGEPGGANELGDAGNADPRSFWRLESPWWAVERDEAERDARLKHLVFADLDARHAFERVQGIEELERLHARGAHGPEDFPRLIKLLLQERYYGDRVARLTALARNAAYDKESGRLDSALAQQLVEVLAVGFPGEAVADVVSVLESSDPELTRTAAIDERPLLRALAAAGMARIGGAKELELLSGLLSDPDSNVEAAAVLAFAENGLHQADIDIQYRARIAEPRVRTAALRAVGILGMEGALEILVEGLADPHQGVQIASAEGLADLADPESASLLVSLLGRGSRSPLYAPAQRGLRALEEDAHEALLRVARSAAATSRRDALLLLAEDLVPESTGLLISALRISPSDARVASELAILSGIDFRERPEPADAWADWWTTVVRTDPLSWFRAACERSGIRTPAAGEFAGKATPAARLFLADLLNHPENHLVERARRELSRILSVHLRTPPARGLLRDTWIAELKLQLVASSAASD